MKQRFVRNVWRRKQGAQVYRLVEAQSTELTIPLFRLRIGFVHFWPPFFFCPKLARSAYLCDDVLWPKFYAQAATTTTRRLHSDSARTINSLHHGGDLFYSPRLPPRKPIRTRCKNGRRGTVWFHFLPIRLLYMARHSLPVFSDYDTFETATS